MYSNRPITFQRAKCLLWPRGSVTKVGTERVRRVVSSRPKLVQVRVASLLLVFRGVCWRMTSLLSYCFMNLCIMRDCIERVLRESPVSCQVSLHFPNHAMWQNISKTDKPSLWYFSNQVRQASQKQDARQAQNIYRPHGGRLAVLSRAAI